MDSLCDLTTLRALKHCGSLGRRSRPLIHFLMPNWYWPVSSGLAWFTWTHSRENDPTGLYGWSARWPHLLCWRCRPPGWRWLPDRPSQACRFVFFTLTTNPASLCHCLPPTRGKSVWKLALSNWLASVSLSCKYLWPSLMLLFFFFYSKSLFSFLLL